KTEYYEYSLKKITPYVIFLCAKRHKLSQKELEVIAIVISGSRFKDIARTDGRSIKTLSAQKRNAYLKIGVSNDVELLHYIYWLSDKAIRVDNVN
ncbi:TPA: LuxR C-terminal-related transcriptional regulator, partial [Salmonella enterica subsp. enterica serovar Muenchen]